MHAQARSPVGIADPTCAAAARLLGCPDARDAGLRIERFEYFAATEDVGLLRLVGRWAGRAPRLSSPALVSSRPDGTLRAAALPDPFGWARRAGLEEWLWQLGFAVSLDALRDERTAHALQASADLLLALPLPGERLLCDPQMLEAVVRRRGRPATAVGVGLTIVALSPFSLATAATSNAADAPAPGGGAAPAHCSTAGVPAGTPCPVPAADPAPPAQPAQVSPQPPPDPAPAPKDPAPLSPAPPLAKEPAKAPAMTPANPKLLQPTQGKEKPVRAPIEKPKRRHGVPVSTLPIVPKPQLVATPTHRKPAAKPHKHTTHRAAPAPTTTPVATLPASAPAWSSTAPGVASFSAPAAVPDQVIANFRIPTFLLPIYQAAGTEYGIPWQALAAINEIESDYGRNLSVSTAGALGWMQFMPATWAQYGVDANGDGKKDPYNPVDAIFAAARYLRAAGGDKDLSKGIFAYNHADWYVQSVLARAKAIGAAPADLIGSLTGLTEGHFPVAGHAAYAGGLGAGRRQHRPATTATGGAVQRSVEIFGVPGQPVISVNDGTISKVGASRALGRYVVLEDVYGNTYTYSHLGSVVSTYPAPKTTDGAHAARSDSESHAGDPRPVAPATAGSHARHRAAGGARRPAGIRTTAGPRKERLFAHPTRPAAAAAGGSRQLAAQDATVPRGYDVSSHFTVPVKLRARDVVLKPLRPGAQVIGGTILGRVGGNKAGYVASMRFAIRPAGRGTRAIDPKPILAGWRLLEATNIYRGSAQPRAFGAAAGRASIGQILLMSKETLARRVLSDKRIGIYDCGRRDIEAGVIDRRVLAALEFLASSGLHPYVSTLKCGHSFYVAGGGMVSEHSYGDAVDIAMINGIPMSGHQGPGSITDITVRKLLTLQGAMQPNQVITLMDYPGVPYAWAQGDHADHIHLGFAPRAGAGTPLSAQSAAVLKPGQWDKLISRLAQIDEPVVPTAPSRYALPATLRAP